MKLGSSIIPTGLVVIVASGSMIVFPTVAAGNSMVFVVGSGTIDQAAAIIVVTVCGIGSGSGKKHRQHYSTTSICI